MADNSIPANFTHLPANVVLNLIKGHTSVLMDEAEKNQAVREDIAARVCPSCGKSLTPTTPLDPLKIFKGTGVQLIGQCVPCRYREDVNVP
jgi:hypothetical protein